MSIGAEEWEDTGILTDERDWFTLKQFEATSLIIPHTLFLYTQKTPDRSEKLKAKY